MFHSIHGKAPAYITELIDLYEPSLRLRSSDNGVLLVVPRARTSTYMYGDQAFSVAAPSLWNKLPLTIRSCASETQFGRLLKTYLYREHFCK